MSDFLDLQGAKDLNTDAIHIGAVANSKDPVTGAAIDTHTNRVGGTDYTLQGLWNALGPVIMPWTSETGGMLTQPNQAFLHPANGNYYSWSGTFPKVVAPGADPTLTDSGYVPRTDVVLRSDLISASGSSLVSFFVEGSGYSPRSVKNKLMESISVLDYMSSQEIDDVKNRIGRIDVTASIQTALLENYKVSFPPGKYFINSILYTRSKNWLKGAGITDTEIVLGPNGYIRNIGESKSEKSQNVTITDMSLISEVQYGAKLIYEWCEQTTLDHVLFYHCAVDWVHHFWGSISNCIFYSSKNTIAYPNVGDNGVSGAPKISNCFFDDSTIYVEDTVDVVISNSSFFNGVSGLICKINNWTPSGGAEIGFPVFISNCVFDSINNGESIHIENAAWVKLNGVFVSGGRSANASGIYIYNSKNINFSGVTCYFCGDYGLVIENCDAGSIVGGSFGANKNGGVKVNNSNVKFIGVDFESGGNPEIYGGSYKQTFGINDVASPSEILVIGSYFDDELARKVYAPNGKFKGNTGIYDSVDSCTTSTRPASSSVSDGFEIYDKTLRKKIIFDQVYNAWRDMSGVIV